MDQAEMAVDESMVEDSYEEQPEATDSDQTEEDNLASLLDEEEGEEAESDDVDDIELDGETFKVPKKIKEAVLRNEDYTRKTQEVSEQRRQLEQAQVAFQQQVQSTMQNQQAFAQLAAVDQQLQEFANVDWVQYSEQDPVAAQQLRFQYDNLKDVRNNIAQQISQAQQYEAMQRSQQVAEARSRLQREIKGWNGELANNLTKTARDDYGFSEAEVKSLIDPRMVKVLHDAHRFQQLMRRAKNPKASSAEPTSPVKAVRGKGPAQKNPEKMSADEWRVWREKQIRSRNS